MTAGAAFLMACSGRSVDLGQRDAAGFADLDASPTLSGDGTPSPQTIYESETRVIAFTVDETNLWALLDTADDKGALVTCPFDRCGSERRTLARGVGSFDARSSSTPLVRTSGMLFWIYGAGFPGEGVARCPVNGCEAPTRSEPLQLETGIVGDTDAVYWVDFEGWLTRWRAEDASAERLRDLNGPPGLDGPLIGRVKRVAIAGDYVYFGQDGAGLESIISRVRKDGSEEPEVLFAAEHVSSIGATPSEAYYTSQTLAGSLRAHPVTGTGGERVVVSNQRWPFSLRIADSEAFWISGQQLTGAAPLGALVSCVLPECASTKTWIRPIELQDATRSDDPGAVAERLALNSRWAFWSERARSWGSALRRLPR